MEISAAAASSGRVSCDSSVGQVARHSRRPPRNRSKWTAEFFRNTRVATGLVLALQVATLGQSMAANTWSLTSSLAPRGPFTQPHCCSTEKSWWRADGTADYLTSAELYDPATGTWSATGSLDYGALESHRHVAAERQSLVAGGFNAIDLTSAELYDPTTGTWSATGSLDTARELHTATCCQTAKCLMAGGYNGTISSSAELYDPATGRGAPPAASPRAVTHRHVAAQWHKSWSPAATTTGRLSRERRAV